MHSRASTITIISVVVSIVLAGCTGFTRTRLDEGWKSAQQPAVAPKEPSGGDHFKNVLVIVLENQNQGAVIKNERMRKWAGTGIYLEHFQGLFHPSYHNYLAMVSGREFNSPHGDGDAQIEIESDIPTIGEHLTWRNYAEDYPAQRCHRVEGDLCLDDSDGFFGTYVRRHVPFLSFKSSRQAHPESIVSVNTARQRNQFFRDAEQDQLAQYSFYSPNTRNDGHDPALLPCVGLNNSAKWLDRFLSRFAQTPAAAHTLVVVTYDESWDHEPTNRIYTVLLGPMLKAGTVLAGADHHYNHYNVLRTIEDNFHVRPFGQYDAVAKPIDETIWLKK